MCRESLSVDGFKNWPEHHGDEGIKDVIQGVGRSGATGPRLRVFSRIKMRL